MCITGFQNWNAKPTPLSNFFSPCQRQLKCCSTMGYSHIHCWIPIVAGCFTLMHICGHLWPLPSGLKSQWLLPQTPILAGYRSLRPEVLVSHFPVFLADLRLFLVEPRFFSYPLCCFICIYIYIWVCLKIGYIPNCSHLIGIMISKTIGSRGTLFSDTPKW